jgi:hypothetical protein
VKIQISPNVGIGVGLIGLFVVGMLFALQITNTTPDTQPATPIAVDMRTNKFGTEVDSEFKDYRGADAIVDAGFGWYRHMQIDWARYEVTPGEYISAPSAWDAALDAGIARATAAGLQTIIVIRNSPAWATTSGVAGCASITPSAYISFANFINWVAARYKHAPYQVLHYELGNEPDDVTKPPNTTEVGCWQHASDYVDMLKVVYPVVKLMHPKITLMNGGLVDLGDWAHEFITSGVKYVDALAYHAYDYIHAGKAMWDGATDPVYPANYLQRLKLIRSWLADSTKPNIPIYMNEGAAIAGDPTPSDDDLVRIQAYFAAFMTAQMIGEKLEQYSWWVSYGMPSSYGTSVTDGDPYYYVTNTLHTALAFGISRVEGAVHITTTRSITGASIIKLRDANGKPLWLMWNTNGFGSAPFTYDFGFTPYFVWDVWGNVLPVTTTLRMDDPNRVVWVQPYPSMPK